MMDQRRRGCIDIKPALGHRIVLSVIPVIESSVAKNSPTLNPKEYFELK